VQQKLGLVCEKMVLCKMNNNYIFNPELTSIKINNSKKLFPVQRVFCIGTNYKEHAKEMKSKINKNPVLFIKPNQTISQDKIITLPKNSIEIHHEVELVACIGVGGENISKKSARNHIYGYAVGIDLTKRDIQSKLKKSGKPWELSKVFNCSAPISNIQKYEGKILKNKIIKLKINNRIRQNSNTSRMIHDIESLISYISKHIPIVAGDLIFTGTPSGVSKLSPGDKLDATIDGVGKLSVLFN